MVRRVVPAFVGVLLPIFYLVWNWNWRRRRKRIEKPGPHPLGFLTLPGLRASRDGVGIARARRGAARTDYAWRMRRVSRATPEVPRIARPRRARRQEPRSVRSFQGNTLTALSLRMHGQRLMRRVRRPSRRAARGTLPAIAGRDEKAHALREGLCCSFAVEGPLCPSAIRLGWTPPFRFLPRSPGPSWTINFAPPRASVCSRWCCFGFAARACGSPSWRCRRWCRCCTPICICRKPASAGWRACRRCCSRSRRCRARC